MYGVDPHPCKVRIKMFIVVVFFIMLVVLVKNLVVPTMEDKCH